MSGRTLAVVSAGLSVPSSTRLLADRLGAATLAALQDRGIAGSLDVVELRPHARSLADNLVVGFPNADLQDVVNSVIRADGLIAVTPIFSASYSGLFKTFFDVLEEDALRGKPVLLGATAGTARHSLALEHAMRPLFAYLRAVVVPTGVFAASEDWAGTGQINGGLAERIDQAAAELAELVSAQPQPRPLDSFDDATSFETLLRSVGPGLP